MVDHHAILGVAGTAGPTTIKRAFRSLSRRFHPDRHPNDPTAGHRYREIVEAYQVLSQPRVTDVSRARPVANPASPCLRGRVTIGFVTALRGGHTDATVADEHGRTRRVGVEIPPGTAHGAELVVPAPGMVGPQIAHVRIVVSDHPHWSRHDDDLHMRVAVPLAIAWGGGEVSVLTPWGQRKIRLPAGTRHRQILRVRELGVRAPERPPGSLLVECRVRLPAASDANVRQALLLATLPDVDPSLDHCVIVGSIRDATAHRARQVIALRSAVQIDRWRAPTVVLSRDGEQLVGELRVPALSALAGHKIDLELRTDSRRGRSLAVRLPTGCRDGQRLALRRAVDERDVVLTISIDDDLVRRDGADLHLTVALTSLEGYDGVAVTIPSSRGLVNVAFPPGTQPDDRLRVVGQGLVTADGSRGDLFVHADIELPLSGSAFVASLLPTTVDDDHDYDVTIDVSLDDVA